jgi:hypothetical protein
MKFSVSVPVYLLSLLTCMFFLQPGKSFAQNAIQIGANGKTNYVILIDAAAPQSVKTAATELQRCLIKSSGLHLAIISNNQVPSSPYISLGKTAALENAGFLNTTGTLAKTSRINDGFSIITRGNNLFIFGQDTPDGEIDNLGGKICGTANGVYTFLEDFLGVRWIMAGELGEVIPKLDAVNIPNTNRTVVPQFVYRNLTVGRDDINEIWKIHEKIINVAEVQHSHAWEQTIPVTAYDKHPDWFAEIGGRSIPPSGRYKLRTTNPELVQAYADVIIATFKSDPNKRFYSLSPSDGAGWSTDPESLALYDKDPNGKTSLTKLVLKFYNDVAKIVEKEFPERKLAGYIYADYLYPPSGEMPKLEPNLSLVIANSLSYGFTLYRPEIQQEWERVMSKWALVAKDGVDLYYYDLPTVLKQEIGIITPPAPDILNFIYSHLSKYGFKGVYMDGRSIWPAFAATNYLIAKKMWNPDQDATQLLAGFYKTAYGEKAAPYINNLYQILDKSFSEFYNHHPKASWNLTTPYFTEIYGPQYKKIEALYLNALQVTTDSACIKRLNLLGNVLSLLQFSLRNDGMLPANYKSQLTVNDNVIDNYFSQKATSNIYNVGGTKANRNDFVSAVVTPTPPLKNITANIDKPVWVPLKSFAKAILYAPKSGTVNISFKDVDTQGEFNTFSITDAKGSEIKAGAISDGRSVNFPCESGGVYYLSFTNDWSAYSVSITGAATAYKTDPQTRGFRLQSQKIEGDLSFYFYVPAGIKNFYTLINGYGAFADVISPDGKIAATINTQKESPARVNINEDLVKEGFWQFKMHRIANGSNVYVVLDAKLPQWFSTNPECPLIIKQDVKPKKAKR